MEATADPNADTAGLVGAKVNPAKGLAPSPVAAAVVNTVADGLGTLMLLSFSLNWVLGFAVSFPSWGVSPGLTIGVEVKVNPPKVVLAPEACVVVVDEAALLWEAGLAPKPCAPAGVEMVLPWGDRTAAGVDTTACIKSY